MPPRRVPLSRLWGATLLTAGAALLIAAWFLSRDPGVSGQVQALDDARRLADRLEEEAARLAQRMATGEMPLPAGAFQPVRVRFDETGELIDPRPLPPGRELRDRIDDPEQPRPTPAATWLREARVRHAAGEREDALEAVARGERAVIAGERATHARLLLLKSELLNAVNRPREAARVLEALHTATEDDHFLDGKPLRLVLGHRIASAYEAAGSPGPAREALESLLADLVDGRVPLAAGRLGFEARLLVQTLGRVDLDRDIEQAIAAAQLAAELQGPLRDRQGAALALPGRVVFLDRASGSGVVVDSFAAHRVLRERFGEMLPPSGAFQVRAERGGDGREVALRLALPPGLPDDWWLVLADPKAYTEPAVRRRALLLAGMLVLVLALGVVGIWGARALRRRAELERLRSDFIAGVSHELRTPAASLALLAGNLADGRVRDPGRLQEYYAAMQRDAVRLQRLVADVLDASRLERGSFRVEPVPTDPVAVLRPLAEDQRARLADAGMELEVDLPEDLPEVEMDPAAVERAVANLLENARRYATAGGWVRLCAQVADGELRVEVEDRGPGVPETARARIFEAYERGEDSGALAAGGAGLGLALVRETMRAHGGRAELVEGERGLTGGACFRLSFPLSSEVDEDDTASSGSGPAPL